MKKLFRPLSLNLLLPGCLLLAGFSLVPVAGEAAALERVVIVERHGIRAPTRPPEALSAFSAQPWPAWPVPPGELTPHGAEALRLMGGWLRATYARQGLLPAAGCPDPGSVVVWADGRDHRTVQSGDAVLAGFAPGCSLTSSHGPAGQPDAIFDAVETGACRLDAPAADVSIRSAMPGGLADPLTGYAASLAVLRDLLDPAASRKACSGQESRCFEDGTNQLLATGDGARIKGPLSTASTVAEALALEYDQGFTASALGWGRLDRTMLGRIMTLHNGYSSLTRGNATVAGHNGARLARAILAALDGRPAFPGQGRPAALTIVLGHDTTIWNLAGMLGVRWTLPGQPDDTPPDGALIFEVHGGTKAADQTVQVSMVYQTADQLRTLQKLDAASPPGHVALAPACAGGACTRASLGAILEQTVPASCRQP